MTKQELVDGVAAAHPELARTHVQKLLEALFDAVADGLAVAGRQSVPGLGILTAARRPPREARNPRTGQVVLAAASVTVRFGPDDSLRAALAAGVSPGRSGVPSRSDPLVELVWQRSGALRSRKLIGEVIEDAVKLISESLRQQGRCPWPGFGTFTARPRPARPGRNPRTGEAVTVPAGYHFGFRPAAALKARLLRAPGQPAD